MSEYPLLLKGFTSGWIQKFFIEPFDPLCVMLAMRTKLLLDLIDEMGKSYNLIRMIGFGWIDFGIIPDQSPGDLDSYYPPEINNPIVITPPRGLVVVPAPGQPGYGAPLPGRPGYLPPAPPPPPGAPVYAPPPPGAPVYFPPAPPTPPTPTPAPPKPPPIGGPGGLGGPIGSLWAPWGFGVLDYIGGRASLGGGGGGGGVCCPVSATIGCTSQQMLIGEEQNLTAQYVSPACGLPSFEWAIASGGGSLSSPTGDEIIYTAPETNPECVNNPTIELRCGGAVLDTLKLAITTGGVKRAYIDAVMEGSGENWEIVKYLYYCNDEFVGEEGTCGGCEGVGCTPEFVLQQCEEGGFCYGIWDDDGESYHLIACSGITDIRSSVMKTEGCCPANLL